MATDRTVRQLIEAALRKAGVAVPGETIAGDDIQTALEEFQDLLAEWGTAGLLVPFSTWEAITLVIGQANYTVGENGSPDLNTVRPEEIMGAFVRDASDYDHPVVIIGQEQYRSFTDKDNATSRPTALWYNPTAPNGTVYVVPAPASAEDLYICGLKPLEEPSELTDNLLDDLSIPRNYYNPLKWTLCVELCPEYGREPTMTMMKRAMEGIDTIKRMNAARRQEPVQLDVAALGSGRYNITTRNWWV